MISSFTGVEPLLVFPKFCIFFFFNGCLTLRTPTFKALLVYLNLYTYIVYYRDVQTQVFFYFMENILFSLALVAQYLHLMFFCFFPVPIPATICWL